MTARGKSGKPKSGFPTLPTALGNPQRAADSHIHHSYGGGDGSGCGSPHTASLKQQHPKVGRNKPPKWAKRSCQTHSASDFVLIKVTQKKNRREFQIGSFGGMRAGKSGVKQSMEVPFKFEHVAIRTFKITLDSDLSTGEYAFFMATGQQAMMTEGRISADSGGTVAGRIYDFSVPD